MQKFGKTLLVQLGIVAMFMVGTFSMAWAQQTKLVPNPLRNLSNPIRNMGKTVEADPNKEYVLTEVEGPYLILAAALSGPTARQDANTLVLELRSKHRWNAYVFEKNFARDANKDFGQTRGTMKYINQGSTQFVVLVGNFPSLEDNQFKRTLEEVRKVQPESLKGKTSVAAFSFPNAYGLANPMLPQEHQHGVVDHFIAEINKDSDYSLLRNPRRYTVQIVAFTGRVVVDPKDIRAIEEGRNSFDRDVSTLEFVGQRATELCKFLRDRGVDAYEFHDRFSSIVTVGSFDQPGKQMPNGTMVPDPHIQQIIQQYKGQTIIIQQHEGKTTNSVQCSSQPRLIEVPRVARR